MNELSSLQHFNICHIHYNITHGYVDLHLIFKIFHTNMFFTHFPVVLLSQSKDLKSF